MANEDGRLGLGELDAARNWAQTGLARAAETLSARLGVSFEGDPPAVQHLPLNRLPNWLQANESLCAGAYFRVEGGLEGHGAVLIPWNSAQFLWRQLLGSAPSSPDNGGRAETDALLQVTEQLARGFVNEWETRSGATARLRSAWLAIDMSHVIVESIANEVGRSQSSALAIAADFRTLEGDVFATFVFLPTPTGLEALLAPYLTPEAA